MKYFGESYTIYFYAKTWYSILEIMEKEPYILSITEECLESFWKRMTDRNLIKESIRFKIFDRDSFRCLYCGRSSIEDGIKLSIDHIESRVNGGQWTLENIVTACTECNTGKWTRILSSSSLERIIRVVKKKNEEYSSESGLFLKHRPKKHIVVVWRGDRWIVNNWDEGISLEIENLRDHSTVYLIQKNCWKRRVPVVSRYHPYYMCDYVLFERLLEANNITSDMIHGYNEIPIGQAYIG